MFSIHTLREGGGGGGWGEGGRGGGRERGRERGRVCLGGMAEDRETHYSQTYIYIHTVNMYVCNNIMVNA